jgi:hypothetical protein
MTTDRVGQLTVTIIFKLIGELLYDWEQVGKKNEMTKNGVFNYFKKLKRVNFMIYLLWIYLNV